MNTATFSYATLLMTLTMSLFACSSDEASNVQSSQFNQSNTTPTKNVEVGKNTQNHTDTDQNQQDSKKSKENSEESNNVSQPNTIPPTIYHDELVIKGDTDTELGKMVTLVAYHPDKVIKKYQWKQVSGTSIDLSSNRQGLVTFRSETVGVYEFMVTATTIDGEQLSNHISVTVSPRTANYTTELLRDRAVMGNRSFVMHLSNLDDDININEFTLETSNNNKYKLTANLDQNTGEVQVKTTRSSKSHLSKIVLKYKGTVVDEAYVLLEATKDNVSPYFCSGTGVYCATNETLGRHFVYNQSSPYADVLQNCTFSNQLKYKELCSIEVLPPLGYLNPKASLQQIENRLIVNEEWMGDKFMEFMKSMDKHDDFKILLGSATAIIISDNVQVPFYWALTGAIYLSPYDLYSNDIEYLSVAQPYDYHEHLADGFSTSFMWQYLKDDRNIAVGIDPKRNKTDIHYNFAALLYHELSHANDFYPHNNVSLFDQGKTMFDNLQPIAEMTSNILNNQYPLNSQDLKSLAKYSFKNIALNSDMNKITTDELAYEFINDGANDLYNYYNEKEDMAMLFEETMMKYRFDVDRNVIVFNQEADEIVTTIENRVFDSNVSPRAQMVATHILPDKVEGFKIFFNH